MNVSETFERLKSDAPYYAEQCLSIIDKEANLIPFKYNAGQLELDKALEAQAAQGKPRRALVLKARQVGFSTYVQSKLIQRTTMFENQNALVVAHDIATGDKLYKMGETMYGSLPEDHRIKPPTRTYRRGRFLHFAPPGADAWKKGNIFPNSTYAVDTASEFQAGRGGTYQLAHLSEFAFWERPLDKLTGVLQGVPDTPESLVVVESTANGMNLFYNLWVEAEEGRSDFIPFFWPWWKEPSYMLKFANSQERKQFDEEWGRGTYGEEEPALTRMLEEAGYNEDEVAEKLHWRRRTIANKTSGDISKFHQEYPSSPEEAFVTTGRNVFPVEQVRNLLRRTEITDPRVRTEKRPGPERGTFVMESYRDGVDRSGEETIRIPTAASWEENPAGLWKVWDDPDEKKGYVIGVDVSGGEMGDGQTVPAYQAVQVIDHATREQVACYRSHVDANALAKQVVLAALHYNEAWVAVEITGGWGLPVIHRIYGDWHYARVYIRRPHEQTTERTSKMLGWNTSSSTKALIEALAAEMLREGQTGIKCRDTAAEMLSYVKDEKGKTGPETGRFSDLLIAWMIAQQVANEMPMLLPNKKKESWSHSGDGVTGY